ncbi:MAG: hypothetical protein F082_1999 [bacterium F082]|nr:MAG: hypothetical protein F082_1999 [bacterium F082]
MSQKAIVYYGNLTSYIVPQPTYLFQKDCPSNNVITITESVFLNYLDSICTFSSPCTDEIYSEVVPGMIQIIYMTSNRKYYTINMTHSVTGSSIKNGFLEIDGELKTFSFDFQEIMDEIVNFHILFPEKMINTETFLSEIMQGKRRHLIIY